MQSQFQKILPQIDYLASVACAPFPVPLSDQSVGGQNETGITFAMVENREFWQITRFCDRGMELNAKNYSHYI
ncbi:MAG TPA: hypothetical protein DEG17_13485 [Cyanobacteria bacterium UBA11149]|nr:hypothetical protein [Cyanobacteria bacterium UBA11367]HBE60191.1 hypothetical protein [Cyanobacteria bacterium UBA11366]HBK64071.1 hypothetical protein [Cyanobacteria bacterium UBA11166]HBR75558.1 hypothetical protein [Cyanobacteria bacterium UBA11159]HBS72405.1 hypothetical protein [Cyanobacteria bacterium UBA11153]HBW89854.1 hypothetical protein [Cyanobacteria bacterium UBA11149]HCA94436.1 hypothetical protein [Cyanobacteria bacterium UBA9226]